MTVPVRIFYRRFDEGQFWEFPSISKASDFVKELAEWELQRVYTKKYILGLISGLIVCVFSVLDLLWIRVERRTKCVNECPELTFGTLCGKCERWGPPTKSLIQGKYYYMRVGEVFGPTDSDDSDDYCPTCSDSDSDGWCPSYLDSDSDSDIGFRNC